MPRAALKVVRVTLSRRFTLPPLPLGLRVEWVTESGLETAPRAAISHTVGWI